MNSRTLLVAAAALLALTTAARAPFVPSEPDTIIFELEEIARIYGMDNQQTRVLESGSAAWYYAWPCRGQTNNLRENGMGGVQIIALPDYSSKYNVAFLLMIARWVAKDMGRPSPLTCAFALQRANLN